MARESKVIDPVRDRVALEAEYVQTDPWAIDAVLRVEILTPLVVDPCTGDGRMAQACKRLGHAVFATDLYDWGYGHTGLDFLKEDRFFPQEVKDNTVFMNPPFSLACDFVDRARDLGARKIVCFQRSVWRESQDRREWWDRNPANRIYQCGNRAVCWYGTIPLEERKGGANQPHSWYVWERGNPAGTLLGTVWRD